MSYKNGAILKPIASVKSYKEFEQLLQSDTITQISSIERQLLNAANTETFTVDGFCVPCDKEVSLLVDMQSGGQRQGNVWLPNWRERLECPLCRMNNRQRLVSTLIKQELDLQKNKQVYFMEQVTPIYNWASATFKYHNIFGSEYLGHEYEGGAIIKGIHHEDVENLSFPDGNLDLIVSNDVFEHVPNPKKAFAECARVLKVGGVMFATIPFHQSSDVSIVRAELSSNGLKNLLSPVFHGNPISSEGSLVFTDFGWDLIQWLLEAGFSDAAVDVYASEEYGHLGGGQLVFRFTK
jgi:hypothetical protein